MLSVLHVLHNIMLLTFFVFLHIQHFMRPWQRILNSLLFTVSIKIKL